MTGALLIIALGLSPGTDTSTSRSKGQQSLSLGRRIAAINRSYTQRDVRPGVYDLDHGTFEIGLSAGTPHLYRLRAQVGLFDRLTLGLSSHYMPWDGRFELYPIAALSLYRSSQIALGLNYERVLYAATQWSSVLAASNMREVSDDMGPTHAPILLSDGDYARANYLMVAGSIARRWMTVGVDLGMVRFLENDILDLRHESEVISRFRAAAGLHLRLGNRRYGLSVKARVPYDYLDIGFDIRFGAFERRKQGARSYGWSTN